LSVAGTSQSPGTTVAGDGRVYSVNLAAEGGAASLLADMNADGRADLVYKSGGAMYYFPNEIAAGKPSWGERIHLAVEPSSPVPALPYSSPDARTADLNGDGLFDIIQSVLVGGVANYRVWTNLGGQRFSASRTVSHPSGFLLSDRYVHLADFNGDGLADLVRVTPTALRVLAGLGFGAFAPEAEVLLPGDALSLLHQGEAQLVDMTKDGLVDLVIERAAPGELWYWVNLGNYHLDPRRVVRGLPVPAGTDFAIRWADINGNGAADLVYADNRSEARLVGVDIAAAMGLDSSPNLLRTIDNGLGMHVQIGYRRATTFRVADADAGRPWQEPLPLAIEVVAQVATDDSLGNVSVRRIAYRDGHYSVPFYRIFTGFAEVVEVLEGDASAPSLVTRHFFDTGSETFEMRGKLLRERAEAEDGSVFYDETTQWDAPVLHTGTDGRLVIFPHPVARSRDVFEQGRGAPRRIASELVYDSYGNLVEHRELGVVEDSDPRAAHDERITRWSYAYNMEDWLLRYPIREDVLDFDGEVIARRETWYDDPSFSAANPGEVEQGDKTLVRAWHDPSREDAYVAAERYVYDAYGNTVEWLDPLAGVSSGAIEPHAGHYGSISYDERFHAFPVSETTHLGGSSEDLAVSFAYEEGFGVVTRSTDFNGHQTHYGYDAFGRLIHTIRPGDTPELPTLEYVYVPAHRVGDGALVNYVETRLLDRPDALADRLDRYFISREYFDGLGRSLMRKEEAAPDPETGELRVAVGDAVRFNARLEVETVLQPFFTRMGGDTLEDLLAFENVSAPGWQGVFHNSGQLVDRDYGNAPKTRNTYDAMLRLVESENPDGTVQRTEFEALIARLFDENDADPASPFYDTPVVHRYDGLGRLIQVDELVRINDDGTPSQDLATWTTRYTYRADDALVSIADAQGNQRRFAFDGLRRKIRQDDPDRGTVRYMYDDASNLVQTTDAKSQVVSYTYDGASRVLTEDYGDEGLSFSANRAYDPAAPVSESNRPDVRYVYDEGAGVIDLGYGQTGAAQNVKGRLAYVIDLSGEEHASYDARGRVVWVVKRIADAFDGPMVSYKTEMAFDSLDRVTEVIYPDEDRVAYAYDSGNHLTGITGGASANADRAPYIIGETRYAPSGQRLRTTYGNGIATDYSYDARGRLVSLVTASPASREAPLIAYAYTYDGASNMAAIDDQRSASQLADGEPRRNSQFFTYDDRYRLTQVRYSFALPGREAQDNGSIAYRYDRIGNMLSKASAMVHEENGHSVTNLGVMTYGAGQGAWNRVGGATDAPGPHALTRAVAEDADRTFAYDANGNMTRADDLVCTYDFNDRLVAVETPSMRAEYVYDYSDRRAVKKVWDKDPERGLNPSSQRTILYAGRHFELRHPNEPTKYVFDGDVRVVKTTGTLDGGSKRIQRFRLFRGWNLMHLATTAPKGLAQSDADCNAAIMAVFHWSREEGAFVPTGLSEPLGAGAVLWVYVSSDTNLSVRGDYRECAMQTAEKSRPDEPAYYAPLSLAAVGVASYLPSGTKRAWTFDARSQTWRALYDGALAPLSNLPDFIQPGQPLLYWPAVGEETPLQPSEQALQYYHQDHLGSSNVMVNGAGEVIRETAFYPFGEPRVVFDGPAAAGVNISPYLYNQKERDARVRPPILRGSFSVRAALPVHAGRSARGRDAPAGASEPPVAPSL